MPPVNVQAIVLRRRPMGEADKLLTLFTREMGKLTAVARGARKPTGKLAGATETCVQARFQLASGKTFWIVTQASVERARARLHRLLLNAAAAIYLCELTDRLLEDSAPDEGLFDLLAGALDELETSRYPVWVLCRFEIGVMLQQGYTPVLDSCIRCGKPIEGDTVAFLPEMGGVLCVECATTLPRIVNLSRLAWLTWRMLSICGDAEYPGDEASEQLEHAVHLHLRYHLEREVKSSQVLWQLRRDMIAVTEM